MRENGPTKQDINEADFINREINAGEVTASKASEMDIDKYVADLENKGELVKNRQAEDDIELARIRTSLGLEGKKQVGSPDSIEHKLELAELSSDYKRNLEAKIIALEESLQKNTIKFGPVYRGKTTQGLDVRVLTSYFDSEDGTIRNYFFFGLSNKGQLLGDKVMGLKFSPNFNATQVRAEGEVTTLYRGFGISSVIEDADEDTMQRLANSLGPDSKVVWDITNFNQLVLEQATQDSTYEDPHKDPSVIEKIAEQARWEKLYARRGAVQHPTKKDKRQKVFHSIGQIENTNAIAEININRSSPENEVLTYIGDGESDKIGQLKISELKNVVEQMKQINNKLNPK